MYTESLGLSLCRPLAPSLSASLLIYFFAFALALSLQIRTCVMTCVCVSLSLSQSPIHPTSISHPFHLAHLTCMGTCI